MRKTAAFLDECSAKQVAIDPKKCVIPLLIVLNVVVSAVCKKFVLECNDTKQPIAAVRPLRTAIEKIGAK